MGKSTSNGLKRICSAKNNKVLMAPQKLWGSETVRPDHPERVNVELDHLVQDMKKKGLDAEFQKIIDANNMCNNVYTDNPREIVFNNNRNNKISQIHISGFSEVEPELQSSKLSSDNKKEASLDNGLNYMEQDNFSNKATKDNKLHYNETAEVFTGEAFIHDHSYALSSDQSQLSAFEDDIDICTHGCPLLSETQQYQSQPMDYNNQKLRINEPNMTSTLGMKEKLNTYSSLLSPSSSTSSLISDNLSVSFNSGLGENDNIFNDVSSPESEPFNSSPLKLSGKSEGKMKKPTNDSSISSSILQLETFLECKDLMNNINHSGISTESQHMKCTLSSPNVFFNDHPLLQSPSPIWDRSEAGFEIPDSGTETSTPLRLSPDFTHKVTEWSHSVFHDHDYCVKGPESVSSSDGYEKLESFAVDNFRSCSSRKRKYTFRKKLSGVRHHKIKKAKYLKKGLLRKSSVKSASLFNNVTADCGDVKRNYVPRSRKRQLDKILDKDIEPENGCKLKITGKFQDQFVYYLSKSSGTTSRRRQAAVSPTTCDTIILPAANPGDIVIPHLTDADLEAVRLKGRSALNTPERPNQTSVSSNTLTAHSITPQSSHSSEFASDVDSHIVSTILSMENDSLASPAAPQSHDFIDTTELNPDQPALTESLRIMSGDSTITSEHVLNYLLSVAKDEGLFDNGCGFDSGASAMFPPMQAICSYMDTEDAVENGSTVCEDLALIDYTGDPVPDSSHNSSRISKSEQSINSFDSQALFVTSHHKDSVSEGQWLARNLPSAMPESRSTLSLNSFNNSSQSLTNVFDDFSSLEKQNPSSLQRPMSFEKTLDYLSARDDDIKLENDFDIKIHHDKESNRALNSLSGSNVEDDTPWIVTVTLYCNDVPAIIINNQPYIRLVDIHKQILPAKDTGILKKRCQLLNIPVLTCSEMQRYFLVQYGRAYSSKSSLIISKDHATDLLRYYVTPRPRAGRDRIKGVHQYWRGRSQNVKALPVTHSTLGSNANASEPWSLPASEGTLKSSSDLHSGGSLSQTCEALESSPTQRTRHKKISYLSLLKGEDRENPSPTIQEVPNSVLNNTPDEVYRRESMKTLVKKKLSDTPSRNHKGDITNNKYFYISKNKDSKVKPKSVQKVMVNKSEIITGEQKTKRELKHCLDVDSQGSIDNLQSAKFRPLKLKLNSLMNFAGRGKESLSGQIGRVSCKNSTNSATTDTPLRVLPVAHQTALSEHNAESHLPSQPADIHLDLFLKSNSACVRCATCSQFLSVPHFMQHHHVPWDVDLLTREASQRVLVPRNKENISQQEQQLWAEFLHLQEAVGGFGEADEEETDDVGDESSKGENTKLHLPDSCDFAKTSLESRGAPSSSLLNIDTYSCMETQAKEQTLSRLVPTWQDNIHERKDNKIRDSPEVAKKPAPVFSPFSKETRAPSHKNLATATFMEQDMDSTDGITDSRSGNCSVDSNLPSTRTSTRKRKSKQLFSIETYCTPRKWDTRQQYNSMKSSRT